MNVHSFIEPSRHVFKPILVDDSIVAIEESGGSVFLTAGGQRIARHTELIVAAGAGVCLLIGWLITRTGGPEPLRHLFVVLVFAIAGIPALSSVWEKISRFQIDIDLLMLLGACLAAYVGSPFEGALLLFLFALSGGLESYALRRTQNAITALRDLAPTEATLLEGGTSRSVPLRLVELGATVLTRPGEKVPVDGTVTAGSSSVNESAVTGESIPRPCSVGDLVFAGTQNLDGRLEIRVTRRAADSTIARIVRLVTEARHHPATAQRLIDRIGPSYSIVVIVAAVLVPIVAAGFIGLPTDEAIRRGIALLIVASPCALIIATPVVYLSAIAAAARLGVLVKGGAHLEEVARSSAVLFDKTGTLTTGQIRLTDIDMDGALSEEETLRLAGAVEGSSNHPLAAAVDAALKERGLNAGSITDYKAVAGRGASGIVDGKRVWIGRPELASEENPELDGRNIATQAEQLRCAGKTVSALVVDGTIGLLAFQDTIRDGAAACIEHLRAQGIDRIEMLTGDHEIIAAQVASQLRLDGYQAELTPEGKVTATRAFQETCGTLLLVGDGINDAPALATANVGVAMGSMGADLALEAADIVLMKERIERVAWLHRHARRTATIVRQNLTVALSVICVLSVFAVCTPIPLPLAVIGHEGSTIAVALNALRLLRTHEG